MRVPRATRDTSRPRASGAGGRPGRSILVWVALAAGIVLGVLLTGLGGVGEAPTRGSSAHVAQLRSELVDARQEKEALARLLRVRDLGDLTPARPEVVRLVDATSAAVNGTDVEGLERLFTSNAVLTDLGTERVTHGATAIALAYGQLDGQHLERTTEVFVMGGRTVWAYDTAVCVGDVAGDRFRELVLLPRGPATAPEAPASPPSAW